VPETDLSGKGIFNLVLGSVTGQYFEKNLLKKFDYILFHEYRPGVIQFLVFNLRQIMPATLIASFYRVQRTLKYQNPKGNPWNS